MILANPFTTPTILVMIIFVIVVYNSNKQEETMKIIIKYHGENVEAELLEDYKVRIPDDQHVTIELDQCKNCGRWRSEDEELYGDGYCEHCALMCSSCEQYFCHLDILKVDGKVCQPCHDKELLDK